GGSRWVDSLPRLLDLGDRLERAVGAVDIVFAHNDLLASNLIDDGTRLWLIDWEYAGFGSALFDLANLASNNEFADGEEEAMLDLYFGGPPQPARRCAYRAMCSVSLLRESLWGMVSEIHGTLDIDYRSYAADYLDRFERSLAGGIAAG
ncbi:MAG: phosphotransferase family protein, partial [Hyphomicrobiaceae bacterium]